MPAQIVPLDVSPNSTLSVSLAINGGTTQLGIQKVWNRIGGFWALNIYSQAGVALVTSLPLVTGAWPGSNIMAAFNYLAIGSWFVVNVAGGVSDIPNVSQLGSQFVLLVDDNPGFSG